MNKICNKCNLILLLNNFHNKKQMKDGLHNSCKLCVKSYLLINKDKISNQRKINYYKNHVKNIKVNKSNYLKFKNKRRLQQSIYYENNKLAFKLRNKKYRQNNKQSILMRNLKRKKLLSSNNISQQQINQLLIKHGYRCFYCKVLVSAGFNMHLDHKIPLSKNGKHEIENIAPSCQSCNLKKGTKTYLEFIDILENK